MLERSARGLPSTSRPEDDILYRYRSRRKRELAKEEAERRKMKSDSHHFVNQLPSSVSVRSCLEADLLQYLITALNLILNLDLFIFINEFMIQYPENSEAC